MLDKIKSFESEIVTFIRDEYDPYEFTTEEECLNWLKSQTLEGLEEFFRE